MPAVALASLSLSPADSARAVAQVYSVSLLATVPLAVAGASALALRRASAGTRALVWRSAALALIAIYLGHALPLHWMAWVVPGVLASPLVALGRLQVSTTAVAANAAPAADVAPGDAAVVVWTLLFVYLTGVASVLVSVARGWLAARALVERASASSETRWHALAGDVRTTLGIRRGVRVLFTTELPTPATCGTWRPAVLLPSDAVHWSDSRARAVLLHELAHVKGRDVAFALLARLGCALYWFHPGAWLVARGLHDECELACDDRVLEAGVRASDYAELLARSAVGGRGRGTAVAGLSGRRGLRGRLLAIVDDGRPRRAPGRAALVVAIALTVAIAMPVSVVQLAPTRDVLTQLMRDGRWDARAYAVAGLARRADSVAVARTAAAMDPSPRVRAWAAAALLPRP